MPANSTTQSIYGPITNSSVINIQAKPTRPKALNNIFLRVQSRLELLLIASELVVTMKNLLACLVMLATFCANAQVNDFQLPYNPDAQPDGYIGAADVVELLTYYGQSFTPDGIYINDDSTHMVMDMGEMTYVECLAQCDQLQGSWRMTTRMDLGYVWSQLPVYAEVYLNATGWQASTWFQPPYLLKTSFYYRHNHDSAQLNYSENRTCMCATQERPKVEYSYCYAVAEGSDPTPFQTCANQKVAEGWYPAGGISSFADQSNGLKKASQAFWRWED